MTKNLKIWAALGSFTVAAVAQSFGAAAAPTNATVLQNVNVALTVYTQEAGVANKADTAIATKVKQTSLKTSAILQDMGFSSKAKLIQFTDFGTPSSTNIAAYTYKVASTIYSNGAALFTNPVVTLTNTALNTTNTNNLSFTIDYTNAAFATNPVVVIPVVNGATNSFTVVSNSGSFAITNAVTAGTNYVPAVGFVVTSTGYEVIDGTTTTLLTNMVLFPVGGAVSTNVVASFPAFVLGTVAATNELNGSEKVAFVDADSGTSYSLGQMAVNVPGTVAVNVSGFATGSVNALNLETVKSPLYIDYTNITLNAAGIGYIGGVTNVTVNTNMTPFVTNYTVTNATTVLVKGTITTTLDKVLK